MTGIPNYEIKPSYANYDDKGNDILAPVVTTPAATTVYSEEARELTSDTYYKIKNFYDKK
jgi:hypothetical protein